MGYSVGVLLERADQRTAFDEAVRASGYDLTHTDEGDRSWDDYERQGLWVGYSNFRDLIEALRWHGSSVKAGEASPVDGDEWAYEKPYWLEPRIRVALGEVARSAYASPMGEALRMAETLSYASEVTAERFWDEAMRPRANVRTYRLELPLPDHASISVPPVKVEHDVDRPLWLPDRGRARDAVLDVHEAEAGLAQAERRLHEAKERDEATAVVQAAYEEAERKVAEARERAGAVRGSTQPATDRVSVGKVAAELDMRFHEIEVCVEERDPQEEYRREYELVRAVLEPLRHAGLTDLVAPVRDFIGCHVTCACPTLEELGAIGRAAQEAGIPRLLVDPSW